MKFDKDVRSVLHNDGHLFGASGFHLMTRLQQKSRFRFSKVKFDRGDSRWNTPKLALL